jgi:DNA-binding transcriptional ArsR family regulator
VRDVFATLADPTRRRILETLRHGERSVSELVETVDIHQPGVSRHLRILQESGLVTVRRDAQRRIYRLRAEPLRELDTWLAEYRAQWDVRFDKLGDHLQRQRKKGEK